MSACPNCGRQTARTEDWACQWCGYPLRSDAFSVIHSTYSQLQADRLAGREPPKPMNAKAEREARRLEEITRREAERTTQQHAKKQVEEARRQRQAEDRDTRLAAMDAARGATEEVERRHLEDQAWEESLRMSQEQADRERKEAEERDAAASAIAAAKEAAAKVIQISVDELSAAFNVDNSAAHAKYTNCILRLTGKVARVVANEINNNYAVTVTGDKTDEGLRDVRCKFGTEHASRVKQLSRGEKITILGEYAGVVMDINLRDCQLV